MELKMDKILLILVTISLIIATVQAVQLFSVKSSLDSGSVSIGSVSVKSTAGSPSPSTVIDIQAEIPDQVGGCF